MSDERTAASTGPAGRTLWFYGADAVGKSVTGWEAYRQLVDRGLSVAYVDTDQLGFCSPRPADPAELVAANLGAIWAHYRRQRIDYLVVSGILVTVEHRQRFAEALGGAGLVTVLLQAAPATLRSRIIGRRVLEAAEQQTTLGDAVLRELAEYAERSVGFAALLDDGVLADHRLRTDDGTPAEVAARALEVALGLDRLEP